MLVFHAGLPWVQLYFREQHIFPVSCVFVLGDSLCKRNLISELMADAGIVISKLRFGFSFIVLQECCMCRSFLLGTFWMVLVSWSHRAYKSVVLAVKAQKFHSSVSLQLLGAWYAFFGCCSHRRSCSSFHSFERFSATGICMLPFTEVVTVIVSFY